MVDHTSEIPVSYAPTAVYRRLLAYMRPHWRPFTVALLAMVVVAATETGFAALMKPLMDSSFVERDMEMVQRLPFLMVGLFFVRGVAAFLSSYWMAWVSRQVIKRLRSQMFDQILRLPVSYYDSVTSGTLVSKLIYDVEQIANATTEVITTLVRDSLTVIGLLAWMFYIDWQLAAILLIGTPLVAKTITVINQRFRRYSKRLQNSMGDVTHVAAETIDGHRIVKIFGGEQYERSRFDAINERNQHVNMKLQATNAASVPIVQMVSASAAAAVIYFGSSAAVSGEMTIGTFVSFIAAMMMLLSPTKRLVRINATLQRSIAAAESVFRFLDIPGEPDTGTHRVERIRGAVSFENVSFRYRPEGEAVLQGIDLEIRPGETVALVGSSGSGKSTLAGLLARFYDVGDGRITVDGVDLRDMPLRDLRAQIALVTQHVTLFNDTVAHNIAYGCMESVGHDAIEEAARAANALEFIEQLPEGMDTRVGENGVLLSGGQRQRLAIARALLKDAPILILDEATSALDTESERHIQGALEKLMENRTTLVIAHRLSTIEKADVIAVLERGRIVETGRHADLLAKGGRYAVLYEMQFAESSAA